MRSAVPAETGTLVPWIRRRSLNRFGWLLWTVPAAALLYSNLDPIGEEQLMEGIACVVQHVKTIMRSELPDYFGLKLDGWSHNSEHYLAVFVCYELGGQPRCHFLAVAPLVQAPGQDLSAQGHVDFLRDILSQDYGKTLENCVYLVGDNCATNRRLATLMGVPLLGCASHRLNLTTQNLLENFKNELAQVRDLMIKLKSLNQSAKLRYVQDEIATGIEPSDALELHILHGQPLCKAPWFIQDDDDLAEYLPSPAGNRTLRKLLEDLKKIESVSKELQSKSVSIADVRSYFDALIELWPEFATYLGPRAAIVQNPHFEAGCVKVQHGRRTATRR
ncbi:hypothetical protein PC128_g18919 [Phytophthora cactorum]|nr:hypothetical protein PC128_g18919 [Phytophthora cactorum]